MKKTNILSSLGFLAVILLSSCGKNGPCIKGDGNVITETRTVASFNKIELDGSSDIYITQDSVQSLVIEAEENILKILETEVSGSRLNIGFEKHRCVWKHEPIKVYITMPDLKGVSIDGSGDVYVQGHFDLGDVDLDIDGSGNIHMGDVSASSIGMSISGSGDATFSGPTTVEYFDISIDGSGKVKAFGLPANHVTVDIDGSGDCKVQALQTLNVKISGSGDVYYIGNPQINIDIDGSGDVINSN